MLFYMRRFIEPLQETLSYERLLCRFQHRDLQSTRKVEVAVDSSASMAAGRGDRVENVGGLACLQLAFAVTTHHVFSAIFGVCRHRIRFATYSHSLGTRNKVTTVHQKQQNQQSERHLRIQSWNPIQPRLYQRSQKIVVFIANHVQSGGSFADADRHRGNYVVFNTDEFAD